MIKLRYFVLAAALQAAALAADPALLRLVMPDAKVVAGLQVDQAKSSLFGQYVLSHMQVDDASFQKFVAQTGFDPRRDVSEIVIASNWQSSTPESRWLVLAHGAFDLSKIASAAQANGGTLTSFQGLNILTYSEQQGTQLGIAFFNSSSAVMGDLPSVEAAIQRQQSNAPVSAALLAKVGGLSANTDFWFVTLVPISEFASDIPDPNLNGALKGNLLAAVNQVSGGVKFGDPVTISAEAVTRSDKDAQALVDVVKFIAGLVQMNRQNDPAAGQVATLLDTLQTKTAGNTMSMSLAIPELQLEQLFQMVRQGSQQGHKRAAR
jgi:hypothetical protein